MIKLDLRVETINKYNEMIKKEYETQIADLEKRFFAKYSEYYQDDMAWLTLNFWPSVKYALQCSMGVIKQEKIDHSRLMLGNMHINDLVNQYGSF